MKPRIWSCLSAIGLGAFAAACAWDRDTLAEEARGGSLETIKVIVGRFERNPPLYYEMRLERVAKELESRPVDLNLYDDAGVAADRLGKHTEAIEWMARKAKAMEAGSPSKDDKYRYEANLGTFYAHRYGKSNDAKDLDSGIAHIERALEINPDAHFGRERVQLEILKWLRQIRTSEPIPLARYLDEHRFMERDGVVSTIEGLSGLIRLGVAWESVDTFSALAYSLAWDRQGTTAAAAVQRTKELEAQGKKALVAIPGGANGFPFLAHGTARTQANAEYERLRKEAEEWHTARTQFMLGKLRAGKHPDTDDGFWTGFEESKVEVRDIPFWKRPERLVEIVPALLIGVAGTAMAAMVVLVGTRALRKRRRASI